MRNLDLFKADKAMSGRVEEYVKCRVLRKAIMKEYNAKIQKTDDSIKNLENLKGSILEDKIEEQRAIYLAEKAEYVEKRDAQIKSEATFEFTKADKSFKKALKGLATTDDKAISVAIKEWFDNYGLDVTDSTLLFDIMQAIGGKEDFNQLVDTEGLDGISVDNNRALSMLYWVAFRHMATVGTIKQAQIPDIIKTDFGVMARKAKEEARKNKKKAKKNK